MKTIDQLKKEFYAGIAHSLANELMALQYQDDADPNEIAAKDQALVELRELAAEFAPLSQSEVDQLANTNLKKMGME